MLPVGTQKSSPQSPLEDTLVALAKPPPCPRNDAGDAAIPAPAGDLLYVLLLGDNNTIFGVYQDWVYQNPGEHLDGGIAEDGKWKARWEKLFCIPTQRYDVPSGRVGRIFVEIISLDLDRALAKKWNFERVTAFQSVIFQRAQCFDLIAGIVEPLTKSQKTPLTRLRDT